MLSDENLERYARQVIMPQVGEDGQERLLAARVLVVGAGGLGSPVILYLAAAGIGHITILDDEQVELTNLNRQIVHTTASIGTPKVEQAAAAARALNPAIEITPRRERLEDGNVDVLLETHDLVIDCSDNVETRYRLGDASHRTATPLSSAARWRGQLALFDSGRNAEVTLLSLRFSGHARRTAGTGLLGSRNSRPCHRRHRHASGAGGGRHDTRERRHADRQAAAVRRPRGRFRGNQHGTACRLHDLRV